MMRSGGEWKNDKRDGYGKFYLDSGVIYEGEWKNDQMNGQGEYKTSDGVIYTGTFKDNGFYEGTWAYT